MAIIATAMKGKPSDARIILSYDSLSAFGTMFAHNAPP